MWSSTRSTARDEPEVKKIISVPWKCLRKKEWTANLWNWTEKIWHGMNNYEWYRRNKMNARKLISPWKSNQTHWKALSLIESKSELSKSNQDWAQSHTIGQSYLKPFFSIVFSLSFFPFASLSLSLSHFLFVSCAVL